MKILRCYLRIPPFEGGMEKHIGSLTACQRAAGVEVDLLFNRGEATGQGDIQVLPSVDLFRLRPQAAAVAIFSLFGLHELRLRHRHYDILHVHGDWSALLLAGSLKEASGAEVLAFSLHGDLTARRTHTQILPRLVRCSDIIFSTGFRSVQILEASSGKPVIFRPSGVADLFFAGPTPRACYGPRFTILTVARLVHKKNLGLVLDIAAGLPEADFLVVGDGPEMPVLRERVAQERIENVRLLGRKSPIEIREFMDVSHCFLLTSQEEGTPTALLEAMAAGLPVVTSPAGGVAAIVQDSVNGHVVMEYAPEAYRGAIRQLFDKDLRSIISRNNAAAALKYRWPAVALDITAAMEAVLACKRTQGWG